MSTQRKEIKSKRDAFAAHYMLDLAETEDYRYHYGHTSQPVWAFSEKYACVTKGNQKPATHTSGLEWKWKEIPDAFLNRNGYKLWEAPTE